MKRIIESKRSVIIAADVTSLAELEELVAATAGVPGIGGIKLGAALAIKGLSECVKIARTYFGPDFAIVYDQQKAATDIPETGVHFAQAVKSSGIDTVILFPLTGPATQEAWTKACFDEGLAVIVGGVMTHPRFLVSEGGYIADDAPERIYRSACAQGVNHFVVPGTKIDWVRRVRRMLVEELGEGNFVLYAPGFIAQGGNISECGQEAGAEWHAIVGSAIYKESTPEARRQAAIAITSQIVA